MSSRMANASLATTLDFRSEVVMPGVGLVLLRPPALAAFDCGRAPHLDALSTCFGEQGILLPLGNTHRLPSRRKGRSAVCRAMGTTHTAHKVEGDRVVHCSPREASLKAAAQTAQAPISVASAGRDAERTSMHTSGRAQACRHAHACIFVCHGCTRKGFPSIESELLADFVCTGATGPGGEK